MSDGYGSEMVDVVGWSFHDVLHSAAVWSLLQLQYNNYGASALTV